LFKEFQTSEAVASSLSKQFTYYLLKLQMARRDEFEDGGSGGTSSIR
jgi:hypothetical protein